MVCVKLPKRVLVVFHVLQSNEVAKKFSVLEVERVTHFGQRFLSVLSSPLAQEGQGSLLFGMSVSDSA